MKRKIYRTRRLEIKPYAITDYDHWKRACLKSPLKKNKWDIDAPQVNCQRYKKIVSRHQQLAQNDLTYIWGIYKKRTGELVGILDIHILNRFELQKANLGYRIFNHCWRKGYATEALKKIIKVALLDLKLNRLEAVIDLDNIASINLIKTVGLRFEGIRKNYWYQNKNWDDQVVYIADRQQLKLTKLKIRQI